MNRSTKGLALCGLFACFSAFSAFGFSLANRHADTSAKSHSRSDSWRRLALLDEHGQIPPHAMARAMREKQLLQKTTEASANQWVEQGPSNLAGRTGCLVIDPASPLTMWVGAAGGGIWRSYDGATTWTPVGDQLASLAVNALTLDPNNSNTLYAGTGEGYYNLDAIGGFGIFKSTDGGTTWAQLPATAQFSHVNRIAVDPANSSIIVATVQPGGIYRSADGGSTWNQVLSADSGQAAAFCPSSPTRVVASVLDFDSSNSTWSNTAVVSNDSGQTWTAAAGGLGALPGMGRIELAPVVNDATTVFASATDGNVWKSTNGGASYTEITTSAPSDASLIADAIWVDPTNPKRIVVGGQSVFESTDGGVNLVLIGQGGIQTTQPHPGVHCIAASPAYNGVTNKSVYICTSGGVFQAADITTVSPGTGWLPHYQTARTSQFYSVAGDSASGLIFGGLQDNGSQLMVEGLFQSNDITDPTLTDGGFVAIDPSNANNLYGEGGYLQIFQSTNGGLEVQPIVAGLNDATNKNSNYIAPMIIDPNTPSTLLAGGASLWRCTNAGSNAPAWSAIRPPDSAYISAVAIAPGNSGLIWVGQNDGTVAMTTDGTSDSPSWTYVSGPKTSSPVPNRYITRILVDPGNSNVVYVSLGGFTSDNLWETTDGGVTWNPITGTGNGVLPQVPIRAIAREPGSPNTLYVGTEVGLFSTINGGQTWTTSSDLDVNVSVDELTYMNNSNSLLAATHGRGVWILPAGSTTVTKLDLSPSTLLGGNSCTGTVTLSQVAPAGGVKVTLSVNSTDAQLPNSIVVPGGSTTATFTITTNGVAGAETLSVVAAFGASQQIATLTITPPVLSTLSLSPSPVVGGNPVVGVLGLTGIAPAGGLTVQMVSSLQQATLPATVVVPAGQKSVMFAMSTAGVATSSTSTITATQAVTTLTDKLTLLPASLLSFNISPASVPGGTPSIGSVTLDGNAPFGGAVLKLSSNSKSATVPTTITVAGGSTAATFSIQTSVVSTLTSATLTAAQGADAHNVVLLISPTALQSVSVTPGSVVGGSNTVVSGTVSFTGPTPSSGETVELVSSNPKAATVPSSVRVLAGKASASFAVTHMLVASTQTTTLTATCAGVSQTVTLTVSPILVSSVTLSPSTVTGGGTSTGTVTLSAAPGAHHGSVTVKLTSNLASVKLPQSVNVPVGATSAKFTTTSAPVASSTSAAITASVGSSSQQATLTVSPPHPFSLTIKPSTVIGSSTAGVTGTVTLTGAAPAGGITLTLTSSNAAAARVPTSVTIPAGKTSATFTIGHSAVTTQTSVTLTASAAGTPVTATLTVTP